MGSHPNKKKQLPAETAKGLKRWSFCIPVSPDDATLLNAVVQRILELDIPEKEILLCGLPGKNFAYLDKVKIIGKDLPLPPPVNISAKKNLLAKESRFENLCILHDRVILPKNFLSAIEKFGDLYPFVAFQSLYFDDKFGFVPRRYSDINRILKAQNREIFGTDLKSPSRSTAFSKSVFDEFEMTGFSFSSPLRYEVDHYYSTGSLYLVKKPVWDYCRQDENLFWTQFEDVEQGLRASKLGIPSRANVHAFTRSLISRPIFSKAGSVVVESKSGKIGNMRLISEVFPFPRKPLVKISEESANRKLLQFIEKYTPEIQLSGTGLSSLNSASYRGRLGTIMRVVYAAKIPCRREAVAEFISDYEKLVLHDQLPYSKKTYLLEEFLNNGLVAKSNLLENSGELINFVAQRPKGRWFYTSLDEYFRPRSAWNTLADWVSSLLLLMTNGRIVYQPDGFRGYLRSIQASHPPDSGTNQ